jgi:hypothetical protein
MGELKRQIGFLLLVLVVLVPVLVLVEDRVRVGKEELPRR